MNGKRENLSLTWDWLWKKHDQTKLIIKSVMKPLSLILKYQAPPSSADKANHIQHGDTSKMEIGSSNQEPELTPRSYSTKQRIGVLLGPLLFVFIQLFFRPENLESPGIATLAITAWVASWWITEAIPIPLTSLLPIVLFPLTGALQAGQAYAPYANDIIFLIMGGFILALAMERWQLHKRIALLIVSVCGTDANRIILGFIAATGIISMWISNTAATMLMVPMAGALIQQVGKTLKKDQSIDTTPGNFVFGKALMLAIAYSATIGGLGTIIGSPSNAILVAVVNELYDVQISFAQWLIFGMPISITFLLIIWLFITKVSFKLTFKTLPGGKELIKKERDALGFVTAEEKLVLAVFIATAFCWITRSFFLNNFIPGLTDAIIAITAGLVLCLIPSPSHPGKRIFDWQLAKELPWGIFLLYGCGLSLAAGFTQTGLSNYLGSLLTGLNNIPTYLVIVIVVTITIFMTELMSNGASATMLYPIMGALAFAIGVHPYALIIAACLATTSSFMLPVSTPPNAIVFGTGYIKMKDMIKTGLWLNIIVIVLVPLIVFFVLPIMWNFDIQIFPESFK